MGKSDMPLYDMSVTTIRGGTEFPEGAAAIL
jgi:hypothetical protein